MNGIVDGNPETVRAATIGDASAIAAFVALVKLVGEVPTSSTTLYVPAIFVSSFAV